MYKNNKYGFSLVNGSQREKGFSLIELIVVIAIIGILVMLASPRFLGRTKEATLAKHLYNVKTLEDTMDRYVLENDRFPRLSEEAYTSEEVEEYANRIRDLTGEEITLDPEGKYYDIDYVTLRDYVKVPDKRDKPNYILQNPVGKVFFLEELTEIASDRADFTVSNPVAGVSKDNNPVVTVETLVAEGYIPVSTANELNNIRDNVTNVFGAGTEWEKEYLGGLDKKYVQVNDISLSSISNFSPIGHSIGNFDGNRFSGIYDGRNFKVTGLRIVSNTSSNYTGLFGYINSYGEVKNLELVNINVNGQNYVGGLAGSNSGKVSNVSVSGKSTGVSHVGGLIGSHSSNPVTDSYSTVEVVGSRDNIGGLIGSQYSGLVTESYATGNVIGSSYIGGLVGFSSGLLNNSYSTGRVEGENYIGGLIGRSNNSSTTNSYSTGVVTGSKNYVGGLIGQSNGRNSELINSYSIGAVSGDAYVGGLIGESSVKVDRSYSIGDIRANEYGVGGLVGDSSGGVLTNSYSIGNVRGVRLVGGLVGRNRGEIRNSYLVGRVTGSGTDVNAIAGENNWGRVINSYYNHQLIGINSTNGGTGLATNEMKQQELYINNGWDFLDTWSINVSENNGYPILQ